MQMATIGSKNQIVLPKEVRDKIKGLRPGKKVMVYPIDENTAQLKVSDKNWAEASLGIAKDDWKGIDTTEYLNKLRDEWHEK